MTRLRQLPTLSLLCGVLLYFVNLNALASTLQPFSAIYKLSLGSLTFGSVNVTLEIDDQGHYRYQARTITTGLVSILRDDEVTEISEGELGSTTSIPSHYRYHHKRPKTDREVDLTFKWEEKRVINRTADSLWTMSIQPGVQDKFSQQLALMLSLNRGEQPLSYRVADGGRMKTYDYLVQGSEWVNTGLGAYRTIRLDRQKNGRPSKATFWMASELNYLPAKIVRYEGDNTFQMVLSEIRWGSPVRNME